MLADRCAANHVLEQGPEGAELQLSSSGYNCVFRGRLKDPWGLLGKSGGKSALGPILWLRRIR